MNTFWVIFLSFFSSFAQAEKFKLHLIGDQLCKTPVQLNAVQCFNTANGFTPIDIVESVRARDKILSHQKGVTNSDMLKLLSTIIFSPEKTNFIQENFKYVAIRNLAADTKKSIRNQNGIETLPFVAIVDVEANGMFSSKKTLYVEGLLSFPSTIENIDTIRAPFDKLPFSSRIVNSSDGESDKIEGKNNIILINEIVGPVIINEVFLKPIILIKNYLLQDMLEKLEKSTTSITRKPIPII